MEIPGFVVSDWDSVNELISQGVAADGAEAARLALTAGVDMEMVSSNYHNSLPELMKQGKVPESVVDEAVRRILTVKFAKGLFDRPYVDESLYLTAFLKPDALALAREAAAKSCVLLKNENGEVPISHQAKTIALIGPLAERRAICLAAGPDPDAGRTWSRWPPVCARSWPPVPN